jgi:hypothetical protein
MRPSGNDELRLWRLCAGVIVAVVLALVSVAAIPTSNAGRQPKITAVRAKADAHVTAANRRANFAHARRLAVDGRPIARVYVRFRLPNVEAPVRRVSLLAYSHTTSRLGYHVRLATRNWVERTITFANAPRPSSRFVSSGRLQGGAWKAVDVTSLLGDVDEDASFVLTTVGTRAIELASRESGLHGPRLVIEYEDPRTTSTATTQPAPN